MIFYEQQSSFNPNMPVLLGDEKMMKNDEKCHANFVTILTNRSVEVIKTSQSKDVPFRTFSGTKNNVFVLFRTEKILFKTNKFREVLL